MNVRPLFFLAWLALVPVLGAQTPSTPAPATPAPAPAKNQKPEPPLDWHDVTTWGVEGRAFPDAQRNRWFDRLPADAEKKVPDAVWALSLDSAGMAAHFKTDSTVIWLRYKLRTPRMAMPHMPATAVSGIDLYARDQSGRWRWVYVNKPEKQEIKQELIAGLAPGFREYAAYLPLFNGIESLEIGVAAGSKFEGLAPRPKPIVFYGTSITHGACASRAGMVHTAILGRRLDVPVINLGFSGNGRMESSVGDYLVQIDASVFVIDCLPNMTPQQVRERCGPLVKQIRAAHPDTPIVLVEDRRFTNSWIRPERQKFHSENHAALAKTYAELQAEGVTGLAYIEGDQLLGDDTEGATDGSHPNDLGFMRQANAFEPILRKALGR